MANRIGRLIGFGGQPESRTGFQPLCYDKGRAGQGTPRSECHAGPSAHRFQGIRRLSEALLLPHFVTSTFSAIAIEISANRRV